MDYLLKLIATRENENLEFSVLDHLNEMHEEIKSF